MNFGFALAAFLFGLVSSDYSWVDRLWSTLPVGFAWFYAWRGGFSLPLVLSACAVTLWGARLTFNFARKGGYTGTEDYRWPILRNKIGNPILWQLFNLGFICLYQTGLFILFTSPLYMMLIHTRPVLSPFFLVFLAFIGAAVLFEAAADEEQWKFYRERERFREGKTVQESYRKEAEQGFRTSGLFAFSRHPNYFGELCVWWFVYFAAAAQSGVWFNWTVIGPVMLTILFIGSTVFTEKITASKYPAYCDYQRRVSAIIPWKHRKT
ncbi:MAG: DUF1295 domain-containing protein [Spirochaetales bacterium]|nr:DUF1295 domain-containing protein [Spirochaetales bacterium]